MTDEYARFIADRASDAEHALFELRNALMGTGIKKCDETARLIDRYRMNCVFIAADYIGRTPKEGDGELEEHLGIVDPRPLVDMNDYELLADYSREW